MKFIKAKDREQLDRKAALQLSCSLNAALKIKSPAVFGVCGGRSVAGILTQLRNEPVAWEHIHLFMADERVISSEDPESNFALVRNYFFGAGFPEQHAHPFIPDMKKKDFGASAYFALLKQHGGMFDVLLLSAGEDGHVASLFPDHHSVKDDMVGFIAMDDAPKQPAKRVSASRQLLEKSKTAVLLFYGEGKREALRAFQDHSLNVAQCPARLVHTISDAYAVTDL